MQNHRPKKLIHYIYILSKLLVYEAAQCPLPARHTVRTPGASADPVRFPNLRQAAASQRHDNHFVWVGVVFKHHHVLLYINHPPLPFFFLS